MRVFRGTPLANVALPDSWFRNLAARGDLVLYKASLRTKPRRQQVALIDYEVGLKRIMKWHFWENFWILRFTKKISMATDFHHLSYFLGLRRLRIFRFYFFCWEEFSGLRELSRLGGEPYPVSRFGRVGIVKVQKWHCLFGSLFVCTFSTNYFLLPNYYPDPSPLRPAPRCTLQLGAAPLLPLFPRMPLY